MAKKKNQRRNRSNASAIDVRKLSTGEGWVLVHPRAARDRIEDLEEVRIMIDGGEPEVALDELRWLVGGCEALLAGHVMLGELAVALGPDIPLARGHYGYAWQLGEKALRKARVKGPLPAGQLANRPMHEAGRGLAWCLEKLGKQKMADEIAARVHELDPSDPMEVAAMLDDLRSDGLPVVEL